MKEADSGKKVLVVGGGRVSGGRESALVHKYSQSPEVEAVYLWPGNDLAWINCEVPLASFRGESVTDFRKIAQAARDLKIDLVDVASEEPQSKGVVDELVKRKITTFGAATGAARLETDKYFSRREQQRLKLPIPQFHYERRTGKDYLHRALGLWYQDQSYSPSDPSVIKANGLAEGKGVYVADNLEEAHYGLDYILSLPTGWQSGVLFEERVGGPNAMEWSDFFLIGRGLDRRRNSLTATVQLYHHLGAAQDHKRVGEGDTGLNTGGMGAVSWPMFIQLMQSRLWAEAYPPIINGLTNYGSSMVLYSSWMYDPDVDKIWLIEFNTRHGDPEAQVVLPGIDYDYFALAYAAATNKIEMGSVVNFHKTSRVSASVVTRGYPTNHADNLDQTIHYLADVICDNQVTLYDAGVVQVGSRFVTGSGRNFHLVAEADDPFTAREILNSQLSRLSGPIRYRTDIGLKNEKFIQENAQFILDTARQRAEILV